MVVHGDRSNQERVFLSSTTKMAVCENIMRCLCSKKGEHIVSSFVFDRVDHGFDEIGIVERYENASKGKGRTAETNGSIARWSMTKIAHIRMFH